MTKTIMGKLTIILDDCELVGVKDRNICVFTIDVNKSQCEQLKKDLVSSISAFKHACTITVNRYLNFGLYHAITDILYKYNNSDDVICEKNNSKNSVKVQGYTKKEFKKQKFDVLTEKVVVNAYTLSDFYIEKIDGNIKI